MGKRISNYLSVVFAIFKRDLLRIVRNPIALVLILGACALPSAYAWFTTAANWDPYQNTQNIRIAIANDDAGTYTTQLGKIDIGSQVIDELKKNNELGWTYYNNSEEAINSVYEGTCYAALVFPENFSEDFTSILTGDFHQPQIDYYVNEKISASAPDFTNEGADVVQEKIDQSFVSTVATALLNITQKIGHELIDKGNASESALSVGIKNANDALIKTREALQQADPAIDDMIEASQKSAITLQDLHNSIPAMKTTIAQAQEDLQQTRTAAQAYENELQNALNQSAVDMSKAASEASSIISKASADITSLYGEISSVLEQAKSLVAQNELIIENLQNQTGIDSNIINELKAANSRLQATVDALEKANASLYSSLQSVDALLETINSEMQQGSNEIANASTQLRTQISPAFNSSLDSYASALGALSGIVLALEPAIDQAQSTISDLDKSLGQSKEAAKDADSSLEAIQTRLAKTLTDINAIQSSSTVKELNEYLSVNADKTASFISAPVKLKTANVYPVKNYGSGVAAFFSSVAIWVAGFVLIDLLKMRVSPAGLPRFTKSQAYWGRCLLFTLLGIISPLIICIGDLIMGIQCESPIAFICAGLIAGIVYTNLIYALAHAFRYIGKALAVLLLIVQIPGSSGLYPIEMMPGFYNAIHPLLPFTYTIDAFREAIGGFYGAHYACDLLILFFAFIPISIFIGLVLGRWASNLTLLLDRDIGKTGLFDGENVPKKLHLRLGTLLQALVQTPQYRTKLTERVKRFEKQFPKLRRAGWILLAAQFIITFALMIIIEADVNTKLILLMAAVIGILAVDTYLIVIAYMRASLDSKLSLLSHSDKEISEEVRRSLENQENVQ